MVLKDEMEVACAMEALAALEALRLARQFGFNWVVVEGHLRNIISALEMRGYNLYVKKNIVTKGILICTNGTSNLERA